MSQKKGISKEEARRRLKNKTESVKVVVRCRPMNGHELDINEEKVVVINRDVKQIQVYKPPADFNSAPAKRFTFDFVYDDDSSQVEIYQETAHPIVESVLTGYNGTIFAYGQTGTGKTFSMEGVPESEELRGIMPRAFFHVFEAVEDAPKNVEFLVRMSFIEIYQDQVFDLLNRNTRQRMHLKEHPDKGFFVQDLTIVPVRSVSDLMKLLKKGQKSRRVGATAMNKGSSRSHSVLSIYVETSETDEDGEPHYRAGKLNLVDLAGSERQKKTHSTGERLEEAKAINLSLAALGNVIKALVNPNSKHVPFRDSKLTRLLQDSLGGNTKTVMVACVGPAARNFDETVNTLRYANRAKNIKNKPVRNEDPKDALLRQYQDEINKLKEELARRGGAPGVGGGVGGGGGAGGGGGGMGGPAEPRVEEVIVEQVEYEHTGISEQELQATRLRTEQEKERMAHMTEAEKRTYLENKARAEESARLYEAEIRGRELEVAEQRKQFEELENHLSVLQDRMLRGKQDIERAFLQKRALEETEAQLQAQREAEAQLQRELAEAEEAEFSLKRTYRSKREELREKTRMLRTLVEKFKQKRAQLEDLDEEYEEEKADLMDTIRELDRILRQKTLIVESFVPKEYVELIEAHATWDMYGDKWHVAGLELAGNHVERGAGDGAPGNGGGGAAAGGDGDQVGVDKHLGPRRRVGKAKTKKGREGRGVARERERAVYQSYGVDIKAERRGARGRARG